MATTIVLSDSHYLFRRLGELKAHELNLNSEDKVRIVIGPGVVVTASYLLGLLAGHIARHGASLEDMVEWIDPSPEHFGTIHRVMAMSRPMKLDL